MIQRNLLALLIAVLAFSLAGCGTGEEKGAQLAAVPTRSPQATPDPAANTVAANDAYALVSLREPAAEFIAQAEAGEVLEQGVIFAQVMSAQGHGCFSNSAQAGDPFGALKQMVALRWPMLDLSPWQDAIESFPEDELIAQTQSALDAAASAYPLDEPLTVCLLPLPDHEALGTAATTHLRALLPLNAFAVNGDTIVVGCTGGEACLATVAEDVTRAYAYAAQYRMHGTAFGTLTMDEWFVYEGRAEEFVLSLYPDAAFPWTGYYDAEGEENLWDIFVRMTGADVMQTASPGRMYNTRDSQTAWGGVVIGARIAALYRDAHPDLSVEAYYALPPSEFWAAGTAYWGED